MPRIEYTGREGVVWKGDVILAGTVLECTAAEANMIVNGWKQGRYLDAEPEPTRPGMVVNADPVPEHRDPEIVKAQDELDRDPELRVTEAVVKRRRK